MQEFTGKLEQQLTLLWDSQHFTSYNCEWLQLHGTTESDTLSLIPPLYLWTLEVLP
jgi:hypothetical protein